MDSFVAAAEHFFFNIVTVCITVIEFIGVLVLVVSALKALIGYFRRDQHIRLNLAQGIALGLEFKLGGEVLRTTVVRQWSELGILGAIILLRAAMTLLIHWEIKNEEARAAEILAEAARASGKR